MVSVDIEIEEFVWACSSYDIKELIKVLIKEEHLPQGLINEKGEVKKELSKKTNSEIEFAEKLDILKEKYFSISQEDDLILQKILNKYN
jgi:hypothetical protein